MERNRPPWLMSRSRSGCGGRLLSQQSRAGLVGAHRAGTPIMQGRIVVAAQRIWASPATGDHTGPAAFALSVLPDPCLVRWLTAGISQIPMPLTSQAHTLPSVSQRQPQS
jgi:hypothetical protein